MSRDSRIPQSYLERLADKLEGDVMAHEHKHEWVAVTNSNKPTKYCPWCGRIEYPISSNDTGDKNV